MKIRRILSLMLALVMCVGMLAVGVAADGNVAEIVGGSEYATLAEAFAAAQDGDTIRMIADYELPASISVNANVTLDLNSKTITNGYTPESNGSTSLFLVYPNKEFTVDGPGAITNSGMFSVYVLGKATLKGGTISGQQLVAVTNGSGELIIDGATVTAAGNAAYNAGASSILTIKSGTVRTTNSTSNNAAVYAYRGATIMEGGTVQGAYAGVNVTNAGSVAVLGGSVSGGFYGINNTGIVLARGGQISGAMGILTNAADAQTEITGNAVINGTTTAVFNNKGTTLVSGGAVNYTGTSASGNTITVSEGTVNISGGTVNNNTARGAAVYMQPPAGETVPERTLNISDDAQIVSTGFGALGMENATLNMTGGSITAGEAGISNFGDIVYPSTIVVSGGTIVSTGSAGIYHPGAGDITVSGDAAITGALSGIEIRAGTLTVNGGTIASSATDFSVAPDDSGETVTGAAIAVSQHETNKAITVEVFGGSFEGVYAIYEEDVQDPVQGEDVEIIIHNGTFTSSDVGLSIDAVDVETNQNEKVTVTIDGGVFDTGLLPQFAADGYIPADNGDGTYGVEPAPECYVFLGAEADTTKIRADLYFSVPSTLDQSAFTVKINGGEPVVLSTMTPDDTGYKFSMSVYAKNMGDKISYDLSYNGYTVKSGEVSIAQYAGHLAENYPAYADFANAMLVYGAAAQVYFEYDTDDLVSNADLTSLAPVSGERFDSDTFKNALNADSSIPLSYTAINVTFLEDTTLSIALRIKGSVTNAQALAWVAQNVTVDGAPAAARVVKNDRGFRYVIIEKQDVAIDGIDVPITLAVNGAGSFEVSVLNYLVAAQDSGIANLPTLTRALYAYSQAAKQLG